MPEKLNLICPICDKKMVHIWYGLPDEYIENLVNEKQIFYRGLEDRNVDRDSSDRIMYHCYNCNNSFSRNLNIVIHEEEVFYPYEEVDNSSWALTGANGRDARKIHSLEVDETVLNKHVLKLFEKYALIEENEVLFEEENVDDADVILVAFGSMTRNIRAAMKECRKRGLKVGIFRPVTLYPFPTKRLNELAQKTEKFLVVEMNMGQMTKDVKLAVNGQAEVQHFGRPVGKWVGVEEIVEATLKFGGVKNATV